MLDQILTAEELRSALLGHNLAAVARACGLSARTLYRLRDDEFETSLETRLRLTLYLRSLGC